MKKIILTAAFFLTAFAMQAQTATKAQLQGKWRVENFINENGTVDVIKGTWVLNDAGKAHKEEAEELFNSIVLQTQDAVLTVDDTTLSQVILGMHYSSGYTLEDIDGKTFMTTEEGSDGKPQVYVKDNKFHIIDSETDSEIVYIPVK